MRKILLAFALALAAAVPSDAVAQPAAALGHPLPAGDLDAGTVQVKVIAGGIAKPVGDMDVHFAIAGVDHTARTNAEGHATLPGVAPGATVKITVKGANGEVASDEFPMPDHGGVKVLLSTTPMDATPGGGGGGPMMGGPGGGMPEPRMMSGKGRPDQAVDAGTLIATVTYDDLTDKQPPANVPVVAVGYSDEHGVTAQVVNTDASGRALFKGLDRSGATAYFVMTRLVRVGTLDRLETIPPIMLAPTAGWRVMMSGEKRDSKNAGVDDLAQLETPAEVPPGRVMVSVAGVPQDGASAQLIDALTGKVVATQPLVTEPPKHVTIQTSPLQADPQAPAGTFGVQLARTTQQGTIPVVNTKIRIKSGDTVLAEATSNGKDGYASFDKMPIGQPLTVDVMVGAETVHSSEVKLDAKATTGAQVTLMLAWEQRGQLWCNFDAADGPTATYFVQTEMFKKLYRSEPFQPVAAHGTAISILVYPRVVLAFALDANAEDDYLAVRGEMAVRNFSWTPYRGGEDGLIVPLPDGFKGQGVMEEQQVAKDDDGFRVLHPIPPFGITFHVGFSLPIHGDEAEWDMPLPNGVIEGDFAVRRVPETIQVVPPTGISNLRTEEVKNEGATYFVMHDLTLMPSPGDMLPRLRFTVTGLPSPPTWKVLAPKIAGLIVVALVLFAAWIAISAAARAGRARATEAASRKARIDRLYEQLVTIEQTGASPTRRAQVVAELEELLAADRERDKE